MINQDMFLMGNPMTKLRGVTVACHRPYRITKLLLATRRKRTHPALPQPVKAGTPFTYHWKGRKAELTYVT